MAEGIRVPGTPGEELLHAVRGTVAGCLGEVPAVLPLQGSKQALKISQGASTRLRAPKLRGNPPSNRLQLLSPVLGFAPARHGTAPPPPQAEQRAKPGCSTSGSIAVGSGILVRRSSSPEVPHVALPKRSPSPAHGGGAPGADPPEPLAQRPRRARRARPSALGHYGWRELHGGRTPGRTTAHRDDLRLGQPLQPRRARGRAARPRRWRADPLWG